MSRKLYLFSDWDGIATWDKADDKRFTVKDALAQFVSQFNSSNLRQLQAADVSLSKAQGSGSFLLSPFAGKGTFCSLRALPVSLLPPFSPLFRKAPLEGHLKVLEYFEDKDEVASN